MNYDEIFRMMRMGGPADGGLQKLKDAAPNSLTPDQLEASTSGPSNGDILKSLMLSSAGGNTQAQPDAIGGMNHQGRALATLKQMAAGGGGGK